MFRTVLTLLRHRVTYRFLLVLAGTCGLTAYAGSLSGLETAVCALLTCSD